MARCPFAEWLPSPNYTRGRAAPLSIVVVHSTVGAWAPSLDELRRADADPVSAHFLIGLDGRIAQLVDTDDTAWHARSANPFSIGIEHVDNGDHADPVRTPAQYAASARVNRWVAETHGLPIRERIRPHYVYVATACPSGLDVDRIIFETVVGGSMFDPRTNPNDLAFLDNRIREIVLGEPQLTGYAVGRLVKQYGGGLALSVAPAARAAAKRVRSAKPPTRAQVRAGHGK